MPSCGRWTSNQRASQSRATTRPCASSPTSNDVENVKIPCPLQTLALLRICSKDEKGRALNKQLVLSGANSVIEKLVFNARVTGEEVDVEGTHVVSGEVLKGQCKAHAEKIDAPPLRLFFGDVEKARGKSPRLAGVFVSLSGFSGTAENGTMNCQSTSVSISNSRTILNSFHISRKHGSSCP